jgi:CDP-diacylglycerol---glycerol-3-phosphate 3-phosphatidyltransferase
MSIYALKPKFQALLRPLAATLARAGITANQVTIAACLVSVALGLWLAFAGVSHVAFLLVPLWMFVRMAFNAIDGMLAREFDQQSALGAYLNELTDVVSDAALYLPFAFIASVSGLAVGAFIFAATLTEFAGVLGLMVGAERRYDGPMGKSDRALFAGLGGLAVGLGWALPTWTNWVLWGLVVLCAFTIVKRVRSGLRIQQKGASDAT